jgi:SAM-dependent methyltransferase
MSIERLFTNCLKKIPLKFIRYHYYRVEEFIKTVALEADAIDKRVLDIGSQDAPFRKYFTKAEYRTQDVCQNSQNSIDYLGDINEGLPAIADASFDYIICTQVLEHLKRPHVAFREFSRILKTGGKLFLTTHLCFEEHMIPYDYFRFTRYGLEFLGSDAELKLLHIAPHGGIFHLLGLILVTLPIKLFIKRDSFMYYAYLTVFSVPILLINMLILLLDLIDREKAMTLNYECVFKKSDATFRIKQIT